MSKGKILSNMGSGVSGKAAKDAGGNRGIFRDLMPDSEGMKAVSEYHDDLKKAGKGGGFGSNVKAYFKGWDKGAMGGSQKNANQIAKEVSTRRAVAASVAGTAALAVGPRVLSGGNLTTNNRGERDIAGIPFV